MAQSNALPLEKLLQKKKKKKVDKYIHFLICKSVSDTSQPQDGRIIAANRRLIAMNDIYLFTSY